MTDERAKRIRETRNRFRSTTDPPETDDEAQAEPESAAERSTSAVEDGGQSDAVDATDESTADSESIDEPPDATNGTGRSEPDSRGTPAEGSGAVTSSSGTDRVGANTGVEVTAGGDGRARRPNDAGGQPVAAQTVDQAVSSRQFPQGGEPTVDASALTGDSRRYERAAVDTVAGGGDALLLSSRDDDQTVQMLEFFLNEDRYAIEIERISAIVEVSEITRFPRGPDAIDGVTDLRGEITAVLDPTALLSVERNALSSAHYIVVINRSEDKQKLGLRVTEVLQAVTYHESQIDDTEDVASIDTDRDHEFVRGIIKKSHDGVMSLVAWLDVDEVIDRIE